MPHVATERIARCRSELAHTLPLDARVGRADARSAPADARSDRPFCRRRPPIPSLEPRLVPSMLKCDARAPCDAPPERGRRMPRSSRSTRERRSDVQRSVAERESLSRVKRASGRVSDHDVRMSQRVRNSACSILHRGVRGRGRRTSRSMRAPRNLGTVIRPASASRRAERCRACDAAESMP